MTAPLYTRTDIVLRLLKDIGCLSPRSTFLSTEVKNLLNILIRDRDSRI